MSKSNLYQKMMNIKFIVCSFLSLIAATGVITYGYHFTEFLGNSKNLFIVSLGILFASTSMLANLLLGTYSLATMKNKKSDSIDLRILAVSGVGSIPYGFLCFFGYQNILNNVVNVVLSIIVVLVNAGIGYTAIKSVLESLKNYFGKKATRQKISLPEQAVRLVGMMIGSIISLTMYLATCSGITDLLRDYDYPKLVDLKVGFILAVISWLPVAVLFANANQQVAASLFSELCNIKKMLKNIHIVNLIVIILCIFSGTAIAKMLVDAFNPSKQIPAFFKLENIQYLANNYLIILALLSSAALNYFSLNKFYEFIKK